MISLKLFRLVTVFQRRIHKRRDHGYVGSWKTEVAAQKPTTGTAKTVRNSAELGRSQLVR